MYPNVRGGCEYNGDQQMELELDTDRSSVMKCWRRDAVVGEESAGMLCILGREKKDCFVAMLTSIDFKLVEVRLRSVLSDGPKATSKAV